MFTVETAMDDVLLLFSFGMTKGSDWPCIHLKVK